MIVLLKSAVPIANNKNRCFIFYRRVYKFRFRYITNCNKNWTNTVFEIILNWFKIFVKYLCDWKNINLVYSVYLHKNQFIYSKAFSCPLDHLFRNFCLCLQQIQKYFFKSLLQNEQINIHLIYKQQVLCCFFMQILWVSLVLFHLLFSYEYPEKLTPYLFFISAAIYFLRKIFHMINQKSQISVKITHPRTKQILHYISLQNS